MLTTNIFVILIDELYHQIHIAFENAIMHHIYCHTIWVFDIICFSEMVKSLTYKCFNKATLNTNIFVI